MAVIRARVRHIMKTEAQLLLEDPIMLQGEIMYAITSGGVIKSKIAKSEGLRFSEVPYYTEGGAGDFYTKSEADARFYPINNPSGFITEAVSDARYLKRTTDTFTGTLTVSGSTVSDTLKAASELILPQTGPLAPAFNEAYMWVGPSTGSGGVIPPPVMYFRDLLDVDVAGVVDGETIVYSSILGKWVRSNGPTVDAYTKAEINAFFSGTTAISGYNKTNWDTAYGWGNHASAGYAFANGSNASGTWGIDISGNATHSTYANNANTWSLQYYNATVGSPVVDGMMISDGSSGGVWKKGTKNIVQTFLDVNNGTTLNNNISGNANSATNWGNSPGNFDTFGTGQVVYVTGYDGGPLGTNIIKPFQAPAVRTFLGIPSGGETLQSVTDRGAYTTNNITIGINGGDVRLDLDDQGSSTATMLIPDGESRVAFKVNNSEKTTILNNGNVGIGTTSPSQKLTVAGSLLFESGNPQLFIRNSSLATDEKMWDHIVNGPSYSLRALNDNNTVGIDALKINRSGLSISNVLFPNGNIGIGTSSPERTLHAAGRAIIQADSNATGWLDAQFEIRGTNPSIAFHFPGTYGAMLHMGTTGRLQWDGNGFTTNGFIGLIGHNKYIDGSLGFVNDNWYRSLGNVGWYNATYGTGIYSIELGWVETYNSAGFRAGTVRAIERLSIPTSAPSTTESGQAYIWIA